MRKLCCLLLALLCIATCGCQTEDVEPNATPAPLPSSGQASPEYEEYEHYISGRICDKISPDVLVLQVHREDMIDTWGETVHIVTDEFDEWCVDEDITVGFSVTESPSDPLQCVRITAEKIFRNDRDNLAKPIVYLYPETPTTCSAELTLKGCLTCTYPSYENGWKDFVAYPDGTLIFPDGKEYYALYWEGVQDMQWDFTKGYCVRGEDTAAFLEWALSAQGLTPREANEFIIYWLPLMQDNPYNIISFQTTAYTDSAILEVTPTPDSLLRVFMAYYSSSVEVSMQPQSFEEFERHGFTVVEWGGCQVK